MNNHTIAATETMLTASDFNWKVVGVADIDSDGRQELIWHHQTTGGVAAWERNPADGTWFSYSVGSAMAAPWKFGGVGDFNLDGHDDLVWHNPSNGQIALWTMKDGAVTNSGVLASTAASPWTIVGVGDFNRDHYPDLLWRTDNGGTATVVWTMKDRTVLAAPTIGSYDAVWQVVRTGDFNGDGYYDIWWRHSTTGDLMSWQLGANHGVTVLSVSAPGPQWSFNAK